MASDISESQFPIDEMVNERTLGNLPSSGNVDFYLRLFNVKHPFSVPRKFIASINPLSQSWEEGYGLDMESYADYGFVSGTGGFGTTWTYASSGSEWSPYGGSILTGSGNDFSYYFETGLEDITLNITSLVEEWITGSKQNNGLLVKLSGSFEDGTQLTSFYTKKFSARGSEFYFNRPCIEARWNPTVVDDRNNFYASSSLLNATDNTMNLYFYNRVNGSLKNIVGNPVPTVEIYTDAVLSSSVTASYLNVTNPLPGVYRAEIVIDTTASVLYDKWVDVLDTSKKYFWL